MNRILTGIKPTGTRIHLGNEIGMNVAFSNESNVLMIADYHALTDYNNDISERSYSLTAQLLAMGWKGRIYRQSDVPGLPELQLFLSNFINKGYMDRMHAFKAGGESVNMGTYNYAILMAADILILQATHVEVGKDQKQHIELAQILANRMIKLGVESVVCPQPIISKQGVLPGVDGQKMSKSYNNIIPSVCDSKTLRKLIFSIKTDSTPIGVEKGPETIYAIYKAFAPQDQEIDRLYKTGTGWKDIKEKLYELLEPILSKRNESYEGLVKSKGMIRKKWKESLESILPEVKAVSKSIKRMFAV